MNLIGDVMVCVLSSSAADRPFERRSDLTKDYKIGMCCFSAKHKSLRRRCKDWLDRFSSMKDDGRMGQWMSAPITKQIT